MQETNKNPSRSPLTVEQLLQLKRFEKPSEDFWAGFERELKQKRLQALVQPSLWARIRGAVSSVPSHLAPVSAAAALCLTAGLVIFSLSGGQEQATEVAYYEKAEGTSDMLALAETEPAAVEAEENEEPVSLAPQADFVTDVIVPEVRSAPATSFDTYYVVNAFERAPQHLGASPGAFEF